MQSLGVISINIWQALISLANLVILFFVMKKFLFKPVRKVLEQRQAHVDGVYAQADEARAKAEADRDAWNARMQGAREEADRILSKIYNKEYMSNSEKKFMAESESTIDELMKTQSEIGADAGLTPERSQLIATEIIERITNQKKQQLNTNSRAIQK